ncbi:hypothetical protein ACS0TY_032654 [Phlomoides rotata]
MGNCRSCESESTVTAKLILADGEGFSFVETRFGWLHMQRRRHGLRRIHGGDEVLQPGELYFELPSGWRNQRLQVEDMAVLALKASVALASKSRDDDDRIVS